MNKKVVFLAILLPGALGLFAQVSFTVDQAVAAALSTNTSIEQNYIDVQGLKRKSSRSLNGISPSLSLGGGLTRPNDNSDNMFTAYGSANVSFTITAQSISNVKQAKLNYEAGIIDYETTVSSIELAVRKSFYGLLYQLLYIEQQQLNLGMAKARYDQTLEKYKRGVTPELDVISAQVNYESLKPALAQAEIAYQNNLADFKQLIGASQETQIVLSGSLAARMEIGEITLPEHILPRTVLSLQKKLEAAKYGKGAAQASAYSPVISFGYNYNPTMMTSKAPSTWPDKGSLSASITLPLDSYLPWSQAKESIDSAKDTISILELQLEEARITSQVKIDSCLRNIEKSRLSIETGKANVELATRSYEMTDDAYRKGTKDLLTLQNAATVLFEARVSLMSEVYSLVTAVLDLENELNVPYGTLGK